MKGVIYKISERFGFIEYGQGVQISFRLMKNNKCVKGDKVEFEIIKKQVGG